MNIDARFANLKKSDALLSIDQVNLLMMYSDLYLNLTPELADHILTVAGSSAARFKKIQKKILSNRWPEESLPELLKLSEHGFELIIRFSFLYPNDTLDWLPSTIRVIGELSDEEVTKVELLMYRIATKQSDAVKCVDLFYDYVRLYGTERSLIAAIMTTRYNDETLEAADAILTDEFDSDDLSVLKLVSVCEFIESGGSADTPVQWMFELSES